MQSGWGTAVLLAAWLSTTDSARAQTSALQSYARPSAPLLSASAAEPAAAQELFDEARGLMAAQRYAEACPKFEESQRLDPGIGTLFNLAACYEATGRTASAWSLFLEVAAAAKRGSQSERERAARTRAQKLEPQLPRLRILVPPSARCAGLRITRAGTVVGDAQWDAALPTDPGNYSVTVSAPGKRIWQGEVQVVEGETTTLTVAPLDSAVAEAEPARVASSAAPSRGRAVEAASLGTQRWIAIGIGGGAVVAAIVGGVFALNAKQEDDASQAECPSNRCSMRGLAQRNAALANGDRATVALVAAAGLGAAASVLYLTGGTHSSNEHARVQPLIGPGLAGAAIGGAL